MSQLLMSQNLSSISRQQQEFRRCYPFLAPARARPRRRVQSFEFVTFGCPASEPARKSGERERRARMRQELDDERAVKALADRLWGRMGAPRRPTKADVERVLRVLLNDDDNQVIRVPAGGNNDTSD
jgi:hypothetical protein